MPGMRCVVVAYWLCVGVLGGALRGCGQTERGIAAFAAPPALSLRSLVSASDSSFVNALT